jgi:transglutaminase-like putative cysteine protease
MRLRISHLTTFRYATPATSVIQILRLTPRNHDGQYVTRWRIDVSIDCRLDQHEDAFGNISHAFTAEGPFSELTVLAEGEVETRDTQGVVPGAVERFPPTLFLRETPLTTASPAIVEFAGAARDAAGGEELQLLHVMLERLHELMTCDFGPGVTAKPAADAFAHRRGSCHDLTHVLIAAARSLGIPARYVSGYFRPDDGGLRQDGHFSWAEAYVARLGWVAFDPVHGICATDAHVRVAAGLDHLGAAPLRGTRYGGVGEVLTSKLTVEQAAQQNQN